MSVVTDGVCLHVTQHGVMPHIEQLSGSGVQVRLHYSLGQQRAAGHLLAFAAGEQRAAGPLFGTESPKDIDPTGLALSVVPLSPAIIIPHHQVHAVAIYGART